MKKRALLAAIAASCTLAFSAPAFAGAPAGTFSDVPAKHWSYAAVTELSKAGIVEGYGDGTFRGDRTLTRYEMAVIVANAMTKVDKADAKQKAMIDKLAQEYKADLVKIGARVSTLEAAKPNVKMMGQARLTYAYRSDANSSTINQAYLGLNPDKNNYFTYRFRLESLATFGKDFSFFSRITGQQYNVESNDGSTGSGSFDSPQIEQFWVNWKTPFSVKNTQLTVGRQALLLGKGGIAMTTGGKDMIMADYANNGFKAKIALKNNPTKGYQANHVDSKELHTQISGKVSDTINLSLFNIKGLQDQTFGGQTLGAPLAKSDVWSLGVDVKLGDKVSFYGEYAENRNQTVQKQAYWYGFTNGSPAYHPDLGFIVPLTKKGASGQSLIYRYAGLNSVSAYENQLQTILGNDSANTFGLCWLTGTKGFEFYSEHILEKNVALIITVGSAKDIKTNKKVTDYAALQLYTYF